MFTDVYVMSNYVLLRVSKAIVLTTIRRTLVAFADRGGATPGPGRSYALPLKNWDLALGPACDILIPVSLGIK